MVQRGYAANTLRAEKGSKTKREGKENLRVFTSQRRRGSVGVSLVSALRSSLPFSRSNTSPFTFPSVRPNRIQSPSVRKPLEMNLYSTSATEHGGSYSMQQSTEWKRGSGKEEEERRTRRSTASCDSLLSKQRSDDALVLSMPSTNLIGTKTDGLTMESIVCLPAANHNKLCNSYRVVIADECRVSMRQVYSQGRRLRASARRAQAAVSRHVYTRTRHRRLTTVTTQERTRSPTSTCYCDVRGSVQV